MNYSRNARKAGHAPLASSSLSTSIRTVTYEPELLGSSLGKIKMTCKARCKLCGNDMK